MTKYLIAAVLSLTGTMCAICGLASIGLLLIVAATATLSLA